MSIQGHVYDSTCSSSCYYTDEVTLNSLAQERSFSVRDVPRDGNCLFSAVAVQLVVGISMYELRFFFYEIGSDIVSLKLLSELVHV